MPARALGIALALFVCPCGAQTLTFRVEASMLSQHSRQGKKPGETVELTLPGHKIDPPVDIALVDRSAVDRSTPEGLLRSMRSANVAGDADWIAENFAPQDQARLRKLFADPPAVAKSRAYYQSVQKIQMLKTVRIREYTVIIVREDGAENVITTPIPMLKTAQGWRVTNDLAADATMDVVWTAERNVAPKQRR